MKIVALLCMLWQLVNTDLISYGTNQK